MIKIREISGPFLTMFWYLRILQHLSFSNLVKYGSGEFLYLNVLKSASFSLSASGTGALVFGLGLGYGIAGENQF